VNDDASELCDKFVTSSDDSWHAPVADGAHVQVTVL